jgi:hypothetical protein
LVTISWTTEVAIGCLFLAFRAGLEPPCDCQSTGNLTAWCLDPGSCEEIVDPILTCDDEAMLFIVKRGDAKDGAVPPEPVGPMEVAPHER